MKKNTPLNQYNEDVKNGLILSDPVQLRAVQTLEVLLNKINQLNLDDSTFWLRIKDWLTSQSAADIQGVYLWGTVGSGKTYLVDTFFECLPLTNKLRIHFHRFMQRVHSELKHLNNTEDPLQLVADNFAKQYHVICFDEFHVSDITDAMLLGRLFEAFLERKIIIITTSNAHPDNLYKQGLQRSRFLPAIELIKSNMQVVEVSSDVDYRLRYLGNAELYHCPLDKSASEMMMQNFKNIAPNAGRADSTIEIEGRKINTIQCADGVVWFEFSEICNSPRGPADYIEIARQFQTVLIQNIPCLTQEMNDQARRFVTLVDEFYDRNVKLIITSEVAIGQLYQGSRLVKEFERTRSRLMEMRNTEYLGRRHLTD